MPTDAFCGPLVGGALLAHALATTLDREFYYTERAAAPDPAGLYASVGTAAVRRQISGKTVAVIDDVINAGSAVRPIVVGALLTLGAPAGQLFAAQTMPLVSLAALDNQLCEPECCLLCAAGQPLEDRQL